MPVPQTILDAPSITVEYLIEHKFLNRARRRKLKSRPGNLGNSILKRTTAKPTRAERAARKRARKEAGRG